MKDWNFKCMGCFFVFFSLADCVCRDSFSAVMIPVSFRNTIPAILIYSYVRYAS